MSFVEGEGGGKVILEMPISRFSGVRFLAYGLACRGEFRKLNNQTKAMF